jgi:hypothetical protein
MILVGGDAADVAFGDAMALYAVTPDTLLRVRAGHARPLRRARRDVTFLAVSPDAETLVEQRRSAHGTLLRAVRWRSGTVAWEIPFEENPYETSRVSWAADGRRLAIETGGRTDVWIIDRATGRVLRRARATGYLGRQPFSPDDRTLALNTDPAQLLNVRTGTRRRVGPAGRAGPCGMVSRRLDDRGLRRQRHAHRGCADGPSAETSDRRADPRVVA